MVESKRVVEVEAFDAKDMEASGHSPGRHGSQEKK
jgi:hypothetical protein